ncbi:MAG: hypothetical protein IJ560_01375 [Alphaproteobacteria bacterium]|nr:hypothetical protein [Alphaproteobacteria bacterium]
MKKPNYFLHLEYATKMFFDDIVSDGIKIIVPVEGIDFRFYILNTEKEFVFHETKPEIGQKIIKKQYKNYEIFYMNENFELNTKPDMDSGVVAYVCVPKNDKEYKKSKQDRLTFIEVVLTNYYYQENNWLLYVVDRFNQINIADDYSLFHDKNSFTQEDEKWFNKCKTKYGIPQKEINIAKSIIKAHDYKHSDDVFIVKNKNTKNQDIWKF